MNKNIAVAAALVVVVGVFLSSSLKTVDKDNQSPDSTRTFSFFPLSLSFPSFIKMPTLENEPVALEAWATFEKYRAFAKAHDLKGVKSLSHQLSPTCSNPAQRDECDALMESVYLFTADWQQSDFKNVVYDGRQIVMSTDYVDTGSGGEPIKTVLFFTRTTSGEPRVLGVQFCFGKEDGSTEKCVETDPETRDLDENGWWDNVESLFYK